LLYLVEIPQKKPQQALKEPKQLVAASLNQALSAFG